MDMMQKALELMTKFIGVGGTIWIVIGLVIVGVGLKEKTGPQIQSGIWQIVGGGIIISASLLLSTITL